MTFPRQLRSMRFAIVLIILVSGFRFGFSPSPVGGTGAFPADIRHVFVIVEENHDWSQIAGSSTFPYINSLLAQGAHAENYRNVPKGQALHPSEPNYIMMEAGDTMGLETDHEPSASNSSPSKDHLVAYMDQKGISWTAYQEGISGNKCPLKANGLYAPKHAPMLFFQDVTDNNNASSQHCIQHVRPYRELQRALDSTSVASYTFITPNLCNDMHNDGCGAQADAWLSREIPKIMASDAYKDHGAIFLTWDEGSSGNNPIGMIVLSPMAKRGYSNTIAYSHASLLRTIQDIFGLQPYLGQAAKATSLSDLFEGSGAVTPTETPQGQSTPWATPIAVVEDSARREGRVLVRS